MNLIELGGILQADLFKWREEKNITQTSINFVVICYSTTTSFDCVNKCYVSIGAMRLDNFTV